MYSKWTVENQLEKLGKNIECLESLERLERLQSLQGLAMQIVVQCETHPTDTFLQDRL